MNLDWQTVAVGLLVAVACAYLGRAAWATVARRKASSCGGCPSCPAERGEPQVVGLSPVETNGRGTSRPPADGRR